MDISPNNKVPKIQHFDKALPSNEKEYNHKGHKLTGYNDQHDYKNAEDYNLPKFNMEKKINKNEENSQQNLHDSRIHA